MPEMDHDTPELCRLTRRTLWADEWEGEIGTQRWSIAKEPIGGFLRTSGVDREIRIVINVAHGDKLAMLVLWRVLNDAEAVGPEEVDAKLVRDMDCVADGLRECGRIYAIRHVGSQRRYGGPMRLASTPYVTQCNVGAGCTLREDDTRTSGIPAVNKAGWGRQLRGIDVIP